VLQMAHVALQAARQVLYPARLQVLAMPQAMPLMQLAVQQARLAAQQNVELMQQVTKSVVL